MPAAPADEPVKFHEVPEDQLGSLPALVFALIIARAPQGVVLVLNSERKVWELPGGFIDAGEAPRQAAIRELAEEAGCVARDTRWLGVVEVDDGRARFGALLYCEVDQVPAGFSSSETMAIDFWRADHRPAPMGESDELLLRKFGPA
jgi:ADP-ribose pyrophosphatase YjhB (NUDIX family)